MHMKALLQQIETGFYFKSPGQWTASTREAYDFKSSLNARSYCVRCKMPGLQIRLKFEEDKYDIVLPTEYPITNEEFKRPRINI